MDNSERIKELYARKLTKGKTKFKQSKGKQVSELPVRPTRPLKIERITVRGLNRTLFPYQVDGVSFVEHLKGRAIIGDDMGLGKTAQALAYLQHHPEDRPALIVCPSSLKLNWAKEIFMWTEKRKENLVYTLSGKVKKSIEEVYMTGSGRLIMSPTVMPTSGIFIVNYDIVREWVPELLKMKVKVMVMDECHYVKSKAAKRTKAIIKLNKKIPKLLALTGTLIENRPFEAFTVIRMVNTDLFPSEMDYKFRYCGAEKNDFGWTFNGASNIPELHQKLKAVMIRRLKADVLPDLPKKMRVVVPIEIDNRSDYSKAESNLIAWIKATKGKEEAESAKRIEGLARINELKQLAAKGKLEAALDWIEEYLSDGGKLVVFCTHTALINAVYNEFESCAVVVDGSVTGAARNEAVEEFQTNPKVKLFVGQLKAAGVGLTLTAASATCFLELGWNPAEHDQAEDRVHRIGQEADSVFAYYLMGNNTIEQDIAGLIDSKRKVVSAVLDGTTPDADSSLLDGLLNILRGG